MFKEKGDKMYKRIIAGILTISMLCSSIPVRVYAEELSKESTFEIEKQLEVKKDIVDISSATSINFRTVEEIIAQSKFTQRQGHAFAAEQGNNFIDKIQGKNTTVIGDTNIKNGADRQIINRNGTIYIQTKYHKTAAATVRDCFDETGFRYVDKLGNLMKIEVPKEQYDDVIKKFEDRIIEGKFSYKDPIDEKVKYITNPDEARNLVQKGHLTHKQAENLAKAGTIESLSYDATSGVISTGCAFGIATLLNLNYS